MFVRSSILLFPSSSFWSTPFCYYSKFFDIVLVFACISFCIHCIEKLKTVQDELNSLKERLSQSKKAVAEKETTKRRLEKKVENLKILLNSERKTSEEIEEEYTRKIEKLEERIKGATGGAKALLLQQLQQEKESKENLLEKQSDLEREVADLKKQLKEEELKAQRLEEETKRKEEEKKRLDVMHKNKMRELKKKLLDSVMEQEILGKRINDEDFQIGKKEVEKAGVENNIREINIKIETELSDKDQIVLTKKKIAQELERAKADLDDEKKTTGGAKKETRVLKSRVRKKKLNNEEDVHEIRLLEQQQKDLELEIDITALEVDQVTSVARKLKLANKDLENEQREREEEIEEEMGKKEKQLKELDQKYVDSVSQLQKVHLRDKQKIQNKTESSAATLEQLAGISL